MSPKIGSKTWGQEMLEIAQETLFDNTIPNRAALSIIKYYNAELEKIIEKVQTKNNYSDLIFISDCPEAFKKSKKNASELCDKIQEEKPELKVKVYINIFDFEIFVTEVPLNLEYRLSIIQYIVCRKLPKYVVARTSNEHIIKKLKELIIKIRKG